MKITNLNKDLVLHYPLDQESFNLATNRFTDKSAYGNHETSANIATFGADRMGQEYRATVFNGSNDFVCGSNSSTQINANSTVSAWINFTGGAGLETIVANCASGGYNGFYLAVYQGDLRMQFSDNVGYYARAQTVDTIPSGWAHVAETYDGNEIELYINGIQQSVATSGTGGGTYTSTDGGLENFFTGSIADVRIYNRMLGASELLQISNSYRNKLIINAGNPKLIV
jgi:hypothetical protein